MGKKVMLVDDAKFIRKLLKDILVKNGITDILEAPNGENALRLYKAHRPDVVVMDVTMPVMDGITAMHKIVEYDKQASIVVCSAMANKSTVMDAIREGAKDFILKPIQEKRVLETLARLV